MPFDKCLDYKVSAETRQLVWRSFEEGGAFITRRDGQPFKFAAPTAVPPTLKVDAERMLADPVLFKRLVGEFAAHPCVLAADALSGAPNGVNEFAIALGERTGKPVVHMVRPEGAPRSGIEFVHQDDKDLAQAVGDICIVEDISNSGLSAFLTAQIIREANPLVDIHTLSMMQRSQVDPVYTEGADAIAYHTFVRQDIPLTLEAFEEQFPGIEVYRAEA